MQIDLAENASAFDRPFEAQQFYIFNSSVIAIARITSTLSTAFVFRNKS